jgi:hypothetical protein
VGSGANEFVVGAIASMNIGGSDAGPIDAASVGTLHVGGSLTIASVRLNAGVSKQPVLISLNLSGEVVGYQIRVAGNIGKVTVGGMTGSDIFIGLNDAITSRPTSANDLAAPGR